MLTGCQHQLRVGMGGAYALDFNAVLRMARSLDIDPGFVADLLPDAEVTIVSGLHDQSEKE